MAQKIKVIIKRPDELYGHMTWISDTLENLQKTVEGYIECVGIVGQTLSIDGDCVLPGLAIICNEEGRLMDLPHNCVVDGIDFCGPIIAVGTKGDEFADIPISFEDWKGWVKP